MSTGSGGSNGTPRRRFEQLDDAAPAAPARRQRPRYEAEGGSHQQHESEFHQEVDTRSEGCGSSRPAPSHLTDEDPDDEGEDVGDEEEPQERFRVRDYTEDEGEEEGEDEDPEEDPDDDGEDEDEGEGEEPQARFLIYNDTGRPNACPACRRTVGVDGVCDRCGIYMRRAPYGVHRMDCMGLTRGSHGGEIPLR
jgi:hypothetical protein